MKALQATSLFLALGFAGTAQALTHPQLPANGTYAINAIHVDYAGFGGWINRGCLVNDPTSGAPNIQDWNNPLFNGVGQCGLSSDASILLQDGHAAWDISPASTRAGETYYVIKSRVDGRCLIRSNNGYASRPSMYLWSGLGARDNQYCGWPDADALAKNGQAAWMLSEFGTASTSDYFLVMEMAAPTYPVQLSVGDDKFPVFMAKPVSNRWVFRLTPLH